MIDIVFPKDNENEFISMAKKLDYEGLIFVYSLKNFPNNVIKSDIPISYGLLVEDKDIRKAKKKSDYIFVKNCKNIRGFIECNKNVIFFDCESDFKKDFIHQRRSGLNHVICKIATKNNNKIGFSFNDLLKSEGSKRSIIFGRIKSNIKLCNKYKTPIVLGSFAYDPYEMRPKNDLISFFSTLGLNSSIINKEI